MKVKDKQGLETNDAVLEVITVVTQKLGDNGRILVRPSGTEPLVRVMLEGVALDEIKKHAEDIANIIQRELHDNISV